MLAWSEFFAAGFFSLAYGPLEFLWIYIVSLKYRAWTVINQQRINGELCIECCDSYSLQTIVVLLFFVVLPFFRNVRCRVDFRSRHSNEPRVELAPLIGDWSCWLVYLGYADFTFIPDQQTVASKFSVLSISWSQWSTSFKLALQRHRKMLSGIPTTLVLSTIHFFAQLSLDFPLLVDWISITGISTQVSHS